MLTKSIDKLFEIHLEEVENWEKRPYKNNFFEIVFVEKGSGMQCIKEHQFAFHAGNIFLLPPLDCHWFKLSEPTRFYFIRFTDHYFLNSQGLLNYNAWFDRMAYILANYNKIPGDIIPSERERQFIIQNIKFIYQEYFKSDRYADSIISGAVASILNVLARSIEKHYVDQANNRDRRFGELLRYINTHISNNEKLRVPILAEKFHISKAYFSEYFKKQAGVNLAEYILRSKLKIVETKIVHTDLTLKEMAWQLNFTDSSHLAKSFKKRYGMTIKDFKSSGQACCS